MCNTELCVMAEGEIKGLISRSGPMRTLRISVGVIIGGIFIVLLLRNIDFGTVSAIIGRAAAGPLLLALVVYAADFVLRAIRYWVMLQAATDRSEEHTSELQSLMRISYAVLCLKHKN